MLTPTTRGVFHLGRRLEWTWRGTAARHMALLTSVSPGPVRPTNGPLRALKTRPTAVPIDRPPDRQTNTLILAIIRTTFTGPPRTLELRTNATRGSDKPNQTAREPPHRTHSDKNVTMDADERETMQTSTDADAAELPDASTNPPTHERNTPHGRLQTNRCQSEPLFAPLAQGERKQASHGPT